MAEPESLDPDIRALLDHARGDDDLDEDRRSAILGVVASRAGWAAVGAAVGAAAHSAGRAAQDGGGVAGSAAGSVARTKAAALVTTFLVGLGAGVVVDRQLLPPSARPVVATAAVASPRPDPTPEPPAVVAPGVPVSALPNAPSPPTHEQASTAAPPRAEELPSSRGLAAERALLDVARAALARGEPSEALAAADRHGHEFPSGVLAEEREAIAIRALVAIGRREEAGTRAAAFERAYPNSLNGRAVRAAVQGAGP